jgi:predicted transcriptional regulator
MRGAAATRALTIRLPPDLYDSVARLARQRKQSLNSLLHDSLAAMVRSAEDRELYEAFERFGPDADADVSYAFAAQAEVALEAEYAGGR